jgi:hypothetical protein
MTEVEHLYRIPVFLDLVVHENRSVHQFTHARPLTDDVAHVWESRKQIHMIEQSIAKT